MDPIEQNPYAAPQAGLEVGQRAVGDGDPQPWEIGEVLSKSWALFQAYWGVLVGTVALSAVIIYGLEMLLFIVQGRGLLAEMGHITPGAGVPPAFWRFYLELMPVILVAEAFLAVGLARVWVAAARGEPPHLGQFLSGGPRFLTMVAGMFVMVLACYLACILFVVPGIILALGFLMTMFYVADTPLGPIASMRASWRATRGHKGMLFLFLIVLTLINFAGALLCGLGMLVSMPLTGVALAIVYTRLSGRTGAGAAEGSPPALSTT